MYSGNNEIIKNETASELRISNPDKIIQMGQSGTAVKELQMCLNEIMGLNLDTDGIFGNGTKNAVISFQKKYGLTADGIAGPKTNKMINQILSGQAG